MSEEISQKRLKELFYYDPISGLFTRKKRVNRFLVGSVAGHKERDGYIRMFVDGVKYPAHRLVWKYMYGEFPKEQIDHIDHKRDNNSLNNLREVSPSENHRNKPLLKRNTSGKVGVSWSALRRKWCATITDNEGSRIFLGRFTELSEAIKIREEAEKRFKYHINHGKKEC